MVRSKDEILEIIKSRVGDRADDETISFIEDVTDTLNDYETKTSNDGEDWKAKYEENDKAWRQKYIDRFFAPEPDKKDTTVIPPLDDNEPDEGKPTKFEELFKED